MATSQLIDLRDWRNSQYRHLYQEMEKIVWGMQSLVVRVILTALGRKDIVLPIWSRRWEYPWAVLNAELEPGMRVLDGGCGNSPLLPYFARRGFICYGVDIWRDLRGISWKARLLQGLGARYICDFPQQRLPTIQYRKESLEDLSFQDAFIDRVFCISVMEHIPAEAQPRAMREMARVLKPGGLLVMTMDLPRDDPHAVDGIVRASGLRLIGELDYTVPRADRHGYNYEVGGLVFDK